MDLGHGQLAKIHVESDPQAARPALRDKPEALVIAAASPFWEQGTEKAVTKVGQELRSLRAPYLQAISITAGLVPCLGGTAEHRGEAVDLFRSELEVKRLRAALTGR